MGNAAKNIEKSAIALGRSGSMHGHKVRPKIVTIESYEKNIQTRPKGNNSVEWQKSHTLVSPLSGIPMNKRGEKFQRNKDKFTDGKYLQDVNANFEDVIKRGDQIILYIKPEIGGHTSQDEPLIKEGARSIFNFATKNQGRYVVIPVTTVEQISNSLQEIREILGTNRRSLNDTLHACFMGSVARVTELDIPEDNSEKMNQMVRQLKKRAGVRESKAKPFFTKPANNDDEPMGQKYVPGIGYV